MFLLSMFRCVRHAFERLKIVVILRDLASKATFVGDGHEISAGSRITLMEGSSRSDVIIGNHVQMSGEIYSIGHGKVVMHDWSKLGHRCKIVCVNGVEIGRDTAIADDVTIVDNNFHPVNPADRRYMRHTPHGSKERSNTQSANAPIRIGENVWIGTKVWICKGVTIGDNAVIAACSVVTKSVPANAIAAGNPAKIVKEDIDKNTVPVFQLWHSNRYIVSNR